MKRRKKGKKQGKKNKIYGEERAKVKKKERKK